MSQKSGVIQQNSCVCAQWKTDECCRPIIPATWKTEIGNYMAIVGNLVISSITIKTKREARGETQWISTCLACETLQVQSPVVWVEVSVVGLESRRPQERGSLQLRKTDLNNNKKKTKQPYWYPLTPWCWISSLQN